VFQDNFRSVWLGVLHNKVATFINVGGLTLGLTVFFALTFYVQREFSYDAHWEDADRIYQTAGAQETPNSSTASIMGSAPYVLGTSLQSRNAGMFDVYTRVYRPVRTITVDEKEYRNQNVSYAEAGLLDLFQLETVEGSLQEVFANPRSLGISVKVVEKFFGKESPLGKTVTITDDQKTEVDYVIGAVYNLPEPSSLDNMQLLALLDPAALPAQNVSLDIWNPLQGPPPQQQPFFVSHYFKLQQGINPRFLETDLRAFMDENRFMQYGDTKTRYVLRPLRDVHLSPGVFATGDNVRRLWIFAAIGVLVLLISGCNFVMLATLRSIDRMREVGIRKTIGGEAGQLMRQYLLDALCHTLLAAALALALLKFCMPSLQVMLQLPAGFGELGWRGLLLSFAIVAGFTLVSCLYPAWLTTRGKPALMLRDGTGTVLAGGNGLRRNLVGIQFAIVVILLLASAVVKQQIDYVKNRDRGYSFDNVVGLGAFFSNETRSKMRTLETEFAKVPGVSVIASGNLSPAVFYLIPPSLIRTVMPDGTVKEALLEQSSIGPDFFKTLSVPIYAGREFSPAIEGTIPVTQNTNAAPSEIKLILNDTAAKALGFTTPDMAVDRLLETEVKNNDGQLRKLVYRVIGVVADTQFASVLVPPVPQLYVLAQQGNLLAVKLEPEADMISVTAALKEIWVSIVGDAEFSPINIAEIMNGQLRREQFEARIVIASAVLAMVIALLGLYALVAATVVKRVKEIGVRKVMGADRMTIVRLLLWQFTKPVVLANLLAWPLGYWAVMQWLQRFPYQIDMQLIVQSGLAASAVALLIAWLTVGFMAAKATSVKPVLALRYE
jgi:putative ABC transport system permease protein